MNEIDPVSKKNYLALENKSVTIPEKEIKKMIYAFQKFRDYYQLENIVIANQRFITKQVYKYKNNTLNQMDLISEANLGLMEAVEKFDISKNNTFLTYAGNWIKQKILIYINNYSLPVHIPFNIVWDYYKVEKFIRKYREKNYNNPFKQFPDINEIVKNVNFSRIKVQDVINYKIYLYDKKMSLYNEDYNDNKENELINKFTYELDENTSFLLDKLSDYLNETEIKIISLYVGLIGKEMSFMEISNELNIPIKEIKNIYDNAIKTLKEKNFTI